MRTSWGVSQKVHGHSAFPWPVFLSVSNGWLGIFLQFLAAVLIFRVWQAQLSVLRCFGRWDHQQLPSPPSSPHTISGLCAPERMGIPDGAEPSRQLPEHWWDNKPQSLLTGRRWQETAAYRGMALHPCSAFESSVLAEGSAGDGTAWCAGNDLESGGPKHSAGCIASMLAVLKGLRNMLRCKTAAIWLQAIFSLFILCWCVTCSSVENLVSPKRRFELESRQGKHHLSRNHFS